MKVKVLVAQSCWTLCDPTDYSPPGSFVHGIFQARILESVAIPVSTGFPNTGIEPGSPTLQADSLPSEPHLNEKMTVLYISVSFAVSWGGRREEGSGWGTHAYLWRIHFDIWQN